MTRWCVACSYYATAVMSVRCDRCPGWHKAPPTNVHHRDVTDAPGTDRPHERRP